MRGLRSFITQSPAIGISIAALTLSLGGGAYAATAIAGSQGRAHAASSRTLTASSINFHRLTLINGWKGGGTSGTGSNGPPGYAISGGVVYLRGALHGGGSAQFAVLPRAARPAHDLWIPVVNANQGDGAIFIRRNGVMSLLNPNANAAVFSSLAGVSYPRNS